MNHQLRSGLPPKAPDFLADEAAEALQAFVTSEGWKTVAVPALRAKKATYERRLATGAHLDIEEIRILQACWNLCDDMIEHAKEFFKP